MARSCTVAVIGAGVSGLAAARELLREGHNVAVFEKSDQIGGTWVYRSEIDSDPIGLDPARTIVHGSLYASLRTNLPRQLMGFTDFPLTDRSFGDERDFPRHEEIRAFVEEFARDGGVTGLVRLRTEVIRVKHGGRRKQWTVEWRRDAEEEAAGMDEFDAVVVCNGHTSEPRLPEIPGIDAWPGRQIHSHNYRTPEPFQNQIVIVIGMGASAVDISLEVSRLAKEVHIASRSPVVTVGKSWRDNIWQHSMVNSVDRDGRVHFAEGSSLIADIILYCTGYKYHFPFLELDEITVDDNRVGPLYKHVFPPKYAPWLSFVGIPFKAIIFLMIEFQSKWIARVLSNKVSPPSENEMMISVQEYYHQMDEIEKPKRYTHSLYPDDDEEYLNWLADEVGMPRVGWRCQLYGTLVKDLFTLGDHYRDKWHKVSSIKLPDLSTKDVY